MTQPAEGAVQQRAGGKEELVALLEHLCHEVSQPLSELETTAYYLGMMMEGAEPALQRRTEQLRLLVRQASWLVQDAAHFHDAGPRVAARVDLNAVVEEVCGYFALHDEWAVRFIPTPAPLPVSIDPETFVRLLRHLLSFLRDVACVAEEPSLETARDGGTVRLAIRCDVRRPAPEMAALLDPPGVAGGLRRSASALGFEARVRGAGALLRIDLSFPAAQDEGDESGVSDLVESQGA